MFLIRQFKDKNNILYIQIFIDMNNKKYTKAFNKVKKIYDTKSKDVRIKSILNDIKKDKGCGCGG
jgi:tRNA A22 N-methylase